MTGIVAAPLRPQVARLAAWFALSTLVVAGRGVCLLAQRVPPLVVVVRFLRRRSAHRSLRRNRRPQRQRHPWSTGPMPLPRENPAATAPVT